LAFAGRRPYDHGGGDELAAERSRDEDDAQGGRLRSAMLDDGQPWLTWWLPLPGIAFAMLWAGYQAVSADDAITTLMRTLAWPGAAIFLVTTVTAYFGWRLDLD
jgi:hypothetical protein